MKFPAIVGSAFCAWAVSGCGIIVPTCETVFNPGIEVTLSDAITGEPVRATDILATATTSGYADTVAQLTGQSRFYLVDDFTRPGTYTVEVQVPAYALWVAHGVELERTARSDACPVETEHLRAELVAAGG